MAGNTDYFPKKDTDLISWCETYRNNLPGFASELDLTPEEITQQQQWCDDIIQKIRDVRTQRMKMKALVKTKEFVKKKNMDQLRKSVRQIKAHDNFGSMTAARLGVTGGRKYTPVASLYQPKFKIKAVGTYVRIDYKKKGIHGIEIFREIPGHENWRSIGTDYHSPFIDNEPEKIKGVPEIRRYRIIALVNDKHFGAYSETAEIVVMLSSAK